MDHKSERTFLFFLTLFLAVMLISNLVSYFLGSGEMNTLMIVCYAGGLVCTGIGWLQHFRGKNRDND